MFVFPQTPIDKKGLEGVTVVGDPPSGCAHLNRTMSPQVVSGGQYTRPDRFSFRCNDCGAVGLSVVDRVYDPEEDYNLWGSIFEFEAAFRGRPKCASFIDLASITEEAFRRIRKNLEEAAKHEAEQEVFRLLSSTIEEKQWKADYDLRCDLRSMLANSIEARHLRQTRRGTKQREIIAHSGDLGISSTVYALHPIDKPGQVRYVGQSVTPVARFKQHLRGSTQVSAWIESEAGEVAMSAIETVEEEVADLRETYWIRYYRDLGLADLNIRA